MKYLIREEAVKDLDDIWIFTYKKWSLEQANKYYELIIKEISQLSPKANSGKSISNIREGYWSKQVKSHVIFYKISNNGLVEIVRILHQKMDFGKRLST